MLSKMKRVLTGIILIVLVLSLAVGCSPKTETSSNGTLQKTTPDEYPLETDQTLTWWVSMSGHVSAHSKSLNETPYAKGLIERTGINIEFIHPPIGQEKEKFNLMIASDELPDIIEYDWLNSYPGGPEKAIAEKTIISLNEILELGLSPNLKKIYDEHPEYAKEMQTGEGNFYSYPFIVDDDDVLSTYMGGMVRKDLLEDLGLEAPETIEEWENVLRAFKAAGVEVPLTMRLNNSNVGNMSAFLSAFGTVGTFYVEDGVVKYGPYEPAYKEWVTLMAKWFEEGLLDNNFMDTDKKRLTSIIASGDVGAAFGSAGGDFGQWIPALQENDPDADFIPVKYPVMNKGDMPMWGQKFARIQPGGPAITSGCENVELAARLLDYGYSEEGHMYNNFGIEGESYNMIDGVPTYTDIILDPEKNGGLGIGPAMGKYIRACYNGPFAQNKYYILQFYSLDAQKAALDVWPQTDALKYKLPILSLTAEENREYTKIMQEIETYREEVLYKTISGKTGLAEFEGYFAEMKDRGIERAIEIQQAAYDRYMSD